jgi:integrase
VQKALTKALRDHEQGLPIVNDRQNIAQFLDGWLENNVKPSVRPRTFRSYEQIVRLYLKPKLGHVRLAKLSPQHLQAMMKELTQEVSAHAAGHARTILRIALGQALKWGLVARNVATLVNPPRHQRPEIQPLSPEEARTFLQSIQGDRLEVLYSVALALGLRQGEALGLRWGDIDLQARTLRVNAALQRFDKRLQLVEPKTERSRRTLPLPETICAALRAHRVRQLEEKMLAGEHWQETGLAFTTSIGTPLDPRNVVRRFHGLLKKAGLPRLRFHDLRHSCASLLLAQGVELRAIMDILGHSQISITADLYTHVMPAMKRDAADLMNAILAGQK